LLHGKTTTVSYTGLLAPPIAVPSARRNDVREGEHNMPATMLMTLAPPEFAGRSTGLSEFAARPFNYSFSLTPGPFVLVREMNSRPA